MLKVTSPVRHPWPEPASPSGTVALVLDARLKGADDPTRNLSAAVRVGETLFLGSDEGASIERLTHDGEEWVGHNRLPLDECLDLAAAEEADIEGLAEDDGWLWVLGSHARTRPKIGADRRTYLAVHPGWVRTDMGGARAPLSIEQSIPRVADLLEDHRGRGGVAFVNYEGQPLPW